MTDENQIAVNKWLTKAAAYEIDFLNGDERKRTSANLAFRRAMKLDGNEKYADNII